MDMSMFKIAGLLVVSSVKQDIHTEWDVADLTGELLQAKQTETLHVVIVGIVADRYGIDSHFNRFGYRVVSLSFSTDSRTLVELAKVTGP